MNETIKNKIINLVKGNTDLINQKQISKRLKISYPTILKYCEIMDIEKVIEIKKVGNSKVILFKGDGK